MRTCPSDNTIGSDPNGDFFSHNFEWDTHRIGWLVAFVCTVITCLISTFPIIQHWRNYTNKPQQRQIIRILYMPPIYAIISFLSYRIYRHATYFELVQIIYEAIGLSCFLLLIIEYVEEAARKQRITVEELLKRKGKLSLPIPLCFWRYRPSKFYFMHTMKFYVMQHIILRPILSVISIVCEAYNVLCTSEGLLHPEFAYLYLSIVDFISITITLYGLIIYYDTVAEELKGKRPLFKFMCIKLIVMLLFYQDVMLSILGSKVTATTYWSKDNITAGISALAICIEMVFFSVAMIWAYPVAPYKSKSGRKTNIKRPVLDSFNMTDIIREVWKSLKFFWGYMLNKPGHRTPKDKDEEHVEEAASGGNGTVSGSTSRRTSDSETRSEPLTETQSETLTVSETRSRISTSESAVETSEAKRRKEYDV